MTYAGPVNRTVEWLQLAACRDYDPEWWWEKERAGRDGSAWRFAAERQAKEVCASCPVLIECRVQVDRDEATLGLTDGIQAGETPKERRARRRRATRDDRERGALRLGNGHLDVRAIAEEGLKDRNPEDRFR